MMLYLILVSAFGFLSCLCTNAQDSLKRSIDSVYSESNDKDLPSLEKENLEELKVILNKEVVFPILTMEHELANCLKIVMVDEVKTGIKPKPYLMNCKSENNPWDFLQVIGEEELHIEKWMYDPMYWNVKGIIQK